jgi:hypothetical protein
MIGMLAFDLKACIKKRLPISGVFDLVEKEINLLLRLIVVSRLVGV